MKKILLLCLLFVGCTVNHYPPNIVRDSYNTYAPVYSPTYAPVQTTYQMTSTPKLKKAKKVKKIKRTIYPNYQEGVTP